MIDPDNDEALIQHLRTWQPAPLTDADSERIIARAMTGKQKTPLLSTLLREVELSLTDWRYRLGYKAVLMAACLVVGVAVGFNAFETTNVTDLAFMRDIGAPS